jgi:putative acetyltransferase
MSQSLGSKVSLRPYVASDARRCAEIFRASIEVLAEDDYSEDQRTAWASHGEDVESFGKKLGGMLTLIAIVDGEEVGFASLKGPEEIDMLFVAPDFARLGVATTLLDALTRLATARGAKRLTSEASDVAKPLFEKFGFVAQKRNLVRKGDEWLANTTMTKSLGPEAPKPTLQ